MNENTTFNSSATHSHGPQSDVIGQLIMAAGRREPPPETAELQTYRAVQAAWQAEQGSRNWRRPAAMAAAVLLTATLGFLIWNTQNDSRTVGLMAEEHGHVTRVDDRGAEQPVSIGAILINGEELHTASGGNALFRRPTSLTVLLGPSTRVKWEGVDALRLMSGILYVDSGKGGPHDNLSVLTSAGRIHHEGTQFSVDARSDQVRIAVREGMVLVDTAKGAVHLAHDQEARIAASGDLRLQELISGAGAWTWLAANQPQFAIENRPLVDVVRDIADASGLQVTFATPEMERQAQQFILHGPVLKLDPTAALDAVLLTTQMRANRIAGDSGSIRITPSNVKSD